jgi:hypothetical protein
MTKIPAQLVRRAGVVHAQYSSVEEALDRLPEVSSFRDLIKAKLLSAIGSNQATVFLPTNEVSYETMMLRPTFLLATTSLM